MPLTQGTLSPVDRLVLSQLPHIEGQINRPEDYAADKLFSEGMAGMGSFSDDGQGARLWLQRLAKGTFTRRASSKTRRGPGGEIQQANGITLDPISGRTFEHSLSNPVDLINKSRAQGINLQAGVVAVTIEQLTIAREERLNDFLTSEWHPDGGDVAVPWTNENANPIEDIATLQRKTRGNTAFFTEDAWLAFCSNKTVLAARPLTVDRSRLGEDEAAKILRTKCKITKIVISTAKVENDSTGDEELICGHGDPYIWVGRDNTTFESVGNREFKVGYCAAKWLREDLPGGPSIAQPTRINGFLMELEYLNKKRRYDITVGHAEAFMKVNKYAGIRLGKLLG